MLNLELLLDVHRMDRLVAELGAVQLRGLSLELRAVRCDEDAAELAAPAGKDLCLDHPAGIGLGGLRPQRAGRERHAMRCQQSLALVFEKFHSWSRIVG